MPVPVPVFVYIVMALRKRLLSKLGLKRLLRGCLPRRWLMPYALCLSKGHVLSA